MLLFTSNLYFFYHFVNPKSMALLERLFLDIPRENRLLFEISIRDILKSILKKTSIFTYFLNRGHPFKRLELSLRVDV